MLLLLLCVDLIFNLQNKCGKKRLLPLRGFLELPSVFYFELEFALSMILKLRFLPINRDKFCVQQK